MSSRTTLIVAIVCVVNLAELVACYGQGGDRAYIERELLVKFALRTNGEQLTKVERNSVLASLGGGSIKHSYKHVAGLTRVKLDVGDPVEEAGGREVGEELI